MKATDPGEFIANCNAGVLAQQIGRALSDVARNTVEYKKKGKVVITFETSPIGDSHQVSVLHKVDYQRPDKRGSTRVDTAQETPFFVTANGLQLFADNPTDSLFKPDDAPVTART